MKKCISFLLLLVIFFPSASFGDYDPNLTLAYLQNHNNSAWTSMALAALNEGNVSADHLKNISSGSAIGYEAPILALTALGLDPRTFGATDYVTELKKFSQNSQIGDPQIINDDIFGVLALISAGLPANDPVVADAKNYILSHQNSDGGFGFSVTAASDTNMTAAAILALRATGYQKTDPAIAEALDFLRSAQNDDGGFPYDPQSQYGTDSDSASSSWVIWALNSLSIDSVLWQSDAGNNPKDFLLNLQTEQGFFEYQKDNGEDGFTPLTTSYAAIALSGKYLPLNTGQTTIPEKYDFHIEGSQNTVCQGQVSGTTALDIIVSASALCGFDYVIEETDFGPYLAQINGEKAEGMKGWIYLVNNTAPNVGAAAYQLSSGDSVLWYYGEFGLPPTASQEISLTATIENGEVEGEQDNAIGFSVLPDRLDFGTLNPGNSASQEFSLINTGDVEIRVESVVGGNPLFTDNLRLDEKSWRDFTADLSSGQTQIHNLKLNVPADYSAESGIKNGRLTFWATAR